jgi:transcriptional regulator with XRE-family HTH domain
MPAFSEVVRSAREARGWTQEELARRAHCDVRTVRRVEAKTYDERGTIRAARRLLDALGLDASWSEKAAALQVVSTEASEEKAAGSEQRETHAMTDAIAPTVTDARSSGADDGDGELEYTLNVAKHLRAEARALAGGMEIDGTPDPADEYTADVSTVSTGRELFERIVSATAIQIEADDAETPTDLEAVLELLTCVEQAGKWKKLSLSDRYRLQVQASRALKTLTASGWDILAARLNRHFTFRDDHSGEEVNAHTFKVKLRLRGLAF